MTAVSAAPAVGRQKPVRRGGGAREDKEILVERLWCWTKTWTLIFQAKIRFSKMLILVILLSVGRGDTSQHTAPVS